MVTSKQIMTNWNGVVKCTRDRKKYDKPKIPYQRVMKSEEISKQVKQKLKDVHLTLNPFILKAEIERKLKRIFLLMKVTSNVSQRI